MLNYLLLIELIVLLLSVDVVMFPRCSTIQTIQLKCINQITLYSSTFERIEKDLGQLVQGENVEYSLNGISDYFDIVQIMNPLTEDYSTEDFTNATFIDLHTMKNGFYHENSRALLFRKYSIYQVRYPTIDQVFYSTIQKCSFVRVIRNNVILLAYDTRLWIAKNNEYYFVDSQILDIEVENGFILVTTSKKVMILYYDYALKETGTVIDSRLLNSLLDTYTTYSIIQAKYALNDLLLLDSTKGVIALKVKSINEFEFDYIYSTPQDASYYSFSVLKDLNSYTLAMSFNTNQLIVQFNTHYFDCIQSAPKRSTIMDHSRSSSLENQDGVHWRIGQIAIPLPLQFYFSFDTSNQSILCNQDYHF